MGLAIVLLAISLWQPEISNAKQDHPWLNRITSTDALVVADPDGRLLYKKNEEIKFVPASTLKLLTALCAIHYLGSSYRFKTEFYVDTDSNLKIKGYGDPLLISEVWQEIAHGLAKKVRGFKDLIIDDTCFSQPVIIPGRNNSTNPYDAPVGALCANFNTVFFDRNEQGRIVPAEAQTPLIPYARKKIRSLGLKKGRYTFTHDQDEAARYAGKLLLHFLKQEGVNSLGKIRPGVVKPEDELIFTYRSRFTLEAALKKMLEFSNNFMANQILIALGAHVYGPPGTLTKGVRAIYGYAEKGLDLKSIKVVEGSGISRKNRVSALDMLAILKRFKPYRHLLKRKDNVLFKTGSLKCIRTRAGYVEKNGRGPYCFVIFLNRPGPDMDKLIESVRGAIARQ
ncbi:MAG: D-alanyl-D-alanine carboxypeptidase [Deltaproteobacteria bacterium]|nr:D-alanyl-D-alanine carboxypeptidase [Deltaproteobacteria bacterium]